MNPITAKRMEASKRWQSISGGQEDTKEQERTDQMIAYAFETDPGKQLLEYLRAITIERRNGPHEPDGALRWSEAQRSLVANLEQRAARHWERAQRPKAADGSSGVSS